MIWCVATFIGGSDNGSASLLRSDLRCLEQAGCNNETCAIVVRPKCNDNRVQ